MRGWPWCGVSKRRFIHPTCRSQDLEAAERAWAVISWTLDTEIPRKNHGSVLEYIAAEDWMLLWLPTYWQSVRSATRFKFK